MSCAFRCSLVHPVRHCALLVWVWLVCSLGAAPAWSGSHDDHERALQAVQSGQVLPLTTVLERLGREHPGQVLEVELEQDDGQWIYEIKLLSADGQLMKLKLDARTAQVLRLKVREAGRGGSHHPAR
ncbi:PepSY domain-containing protein [Simplicispira psychrophila]|uniref:PepSY domain-containing protein n=1 Tax=Simplicispira psychrophila TaxID=80882 RepID=UPI000A068D5A|nr:PepSY domain-containing protein [Simplicispira psychrophila]